MSTSTDGFPTLRASGRKRNTTRPDAEGSHRRAVLQPNGRRHTEMRTAAVWSLIPRRTAGAAGGGRGSWPDDGSGIRFRAEADQTPAAGTGEPHPPAWRLQSTVRLPGVTASDRELPVSVGEDPAIRTVDRQRCARCRHTAGRT